MIKFYSFCKCTNGTFILEGIEIMIFVPSKLTKCNKTLSIESNNF